MTLDEEFAKQFPNIKFPETSEGRDKTYLKLTKPGKLPEDFFDPQIIKNPRFPLSVGSLRNYQPTPRERLVDYLSRTFWDDDRASRARVEFLLRPIDVSPAAIPFAAYDTTRAIGEGRYKDAILPGITAAAPFLGKTGKLLAETGKRRGLANAVSEGADELPDGSLIGPKPANDLAQENLEAVTAANSQRNKIYNPPAKPQRPFATDYPNGAASDEAGNLLNDKYGDPLHAKYRPGRRTLGGDDIGLSPKEFRKLGEDLIGKKIEMVPQGNLGGSSGKFGYDKETNEPLNIRLVDNLSRKKQKRVLAHEVGHAIDLGTGLKPIDSPEMQADLERIYSTLATGDEGRQTLTLPSSRGYSGPQTRNELMAEGYRAAATNPNFFKTVAPRTYDILADRLKKSEIAHLLQLNGLAAATAAGLGLIGQREDSQAGELPERRDARSNLLEGAHSNFGPPIPSDRKTGKFSGLVRALLEAQKNSPSYGDPR